MDLHELTKKALEILMTDAHQNKRVCEETVGRLFEEACATLPRKILREEFMPVMKQIWFMTNTGKCDVY